MISVTVDKLIFKEQLSMIEQYVIKDLLFKWLGEPTEGIDELLPLEYTEDVFAKMEAKQVTTFHVNRDDHFRYATITENNQLIIAVLDENKELKHRILSLDDI